MVLISYLASFCEIIDYHIFLILCECFLWTVSNNDINQTYIHTLTYDQQHQHHQHHYYHRDRHRKQCQQATG